VWIDEYFPHIGSDNIIVANDKGKILMDWIIDDGAHNIRAFKGKKILIDAPYNRFVTAAEYDFRAQSWCGIKMFFEHLHELEARPTIHVPI
jgi:5'(3')-deoxyribonucleotidase